MAFIPGTTGDNSLTGGSGADQIFGFGGKDTIDGGGGDDLIVAGSGGNDLIDGGSGIDKVVLEEDSTGQSLTFDGLGRLDVSGPGGAIESLSGVEQVVFNDRTALVVGAGSEYVTLQQAIDAAEEGDIIIIAAGSYSGNVNVNKEGLTIIAQDGAVLTGTFLSDNGFSDHVDVALRTAPGYSGAAGAGLTISADNITIVGLTIASYLTGVEIGDVSGLTLDGVNIEDTVNGIRKGTEADITDLNIIGGLISHSVFGINFAKALNLSQGFVDGVEINGTSFEHLMEKGIYVEALSNALLTNLVMSDVGEFGRGPAFGGTGSNTSGFGAGIDINLKAGAYENITIDGFTFTDVGSSDGDGSAHPFGGAITVKARDDAPSYGGTPATFDGAIIITNGTITGTSTAIRTGEPGKNISDPAVDVSDVTVSGEIYDYDNVSQSVFTAKGSVDADAILTNSTATGSFAINARGGNDTVSTGAGADTLHGGSGDDFLNGAGGIDTATYDASVTITAAGGGWSVSGGEEGSDALSNIEEVQHGGSRVLLVGNGGYATIQAAIDAAEDGDTIMIAAGTWDEDLDIDKAVTILGAHSGDAGAGGGRDAAGGVGETNLIGDHRITAAGAVVIDGLRFINDGSTSGNGPSNPTLYVTGGYDHVITNSIFWSTLAGGANGVDDRAIGLHGVGGADITIMDNYFTGASAGGFGTASWGRGVWYDGGTGSNVTFDGNTFQFCRTGLNLDMASDSTATIENNTYITNGTAHSVGYTNDGLTFTDNNFNNVGDEFNFRNITDDLVFDAEVALAGLTVTGTANDVVVVLGGEGNDWIAGSSRADYLDDNAAGASFESSTASDNDTLLGRGGNDLLIAENGDDFLDGGAGADSMIGGAGNDTYVLNSVLDQITENAAEGTDLVRTSLHSYTLASNLENLSYSGAGAFTGAGNELANVIDGGSNSDSLSGLAGNDTLSGKVGADVLDGGEGNDSLAGGRGSDTYIIDSLSDIVDETDGNGSDTLVTDAFSVNLTGYTSIENATVTGAANLTLMGNSVANQLTGNDGANVINGAGGADRLTGGAGADVFDYNTTADSLKQASDRITDFQQNVDLIDLFGIDAKESTAPNNGFTWIDTAAFTGEGQLRYFIDGEGNTVIQANTDGDKAVEFQLVLTGTYILSDADFVL